MGLLSKGTPLEWGDSLRHADHIRDHGILQLIELYKRVKDRDLDNLKWGDEIEYTLVLMDDENKDARLALVASQVLPMLQQAEDSGEPVVDCCWRMEYSDYMLESTPGKPFCCSLCRLRYVETSMCLRRMEAKRCIQRYPNVHVINFTSFPRMGCEYFTEPQIEIADVDADNPVSRSLFYPDRAIYPAHPRFRTLTRNIRQRRTKKQEIYVPVYKDENTPSPFMEKLPPHLGSAGRAEAKLKPDHIYMDCMGFGMGCCCLQLTLQACNIQEARFLYDQLVPLAPLMMALSAASPIWKGYLSDVDCRWGVISDSVDDRTPQEYSLMEDGLPVIPKSRYDSVDMYLDGDNVAFNDIRVEHNLKYKKQLMDAGFDEQLATHISHLFIRDPISVFLEKLNMDDMNETDHFENIQSTNWQSVRFKPPPPNSSIGWRVEFRSLETQITDFGNAAFVIFVMLLTRLMTSKNLDLIMPISLVDENMKRAIKRDAVKSQKFHIRKNLTSREGPEGVDTTELSLDTIVNGNENFVGLIPQLKRYLDSINLHIETRWHVNRAISIISNIASGKYLTVASWMRHFVHSHPKYKRDSEVSREILYDLAREMIKISDGELGCPLLMGNHIQHTVSAKDIKQFRATLRCDTHQSVTTQSTTPSSHSTFDTVSVDIDSSQTPDLAISGSNEP